MHLQLTTFERFVAKGELAQNEHNVHKVSYCDCPLSGVRHASSIVRHPLINILSSITNRSFGMKLHRKHPHQNSFKSFSSMHNSGFHGNQKKNHLFPPIPVGRFSKKIVGDPFQILQAMLVGERLWRWLFCLLLLQYIENLYIKKILFKSICPSSK